MKVKSNYKVHQLGEEYIVIPMGAQAKEFNGMIRLNKTGATLWNYLEQERTHEELVTMMEQRYQVDTDVLSTEVGQFVDMLKANDFLEG